MIWKMYLRVKVHSLKERDLKINAKTPMIMFGVLFEFNRSKYT